MCSNICLQILLYRLNTQDQVHMYADIDKAHTTKMHCAAHALNTLHAADWSQCYQQKCFVLLEH